MKSKRVSLAIAALLAIGGWWFAWSGWRTLAHPKSNINVGVQTPHVEPKPGQPLPPPDPTRKFWELSPEQRVQQARHPVGG